jgi:hypothetical protein
MNSCLLAIFSAIHLLTFTIQLYRVFPNNSRQPITTFKPKFLAYILKNVRNFRSLSIHGPKRTARRVTGQEMGLAGRRLHLFWVSSTFFT